MLLHVVHSLVHSFSLLYSISLWHKSVHDYHNLFAIPLKIDIWNFLFENYCYTHSCI